MMDTIRQHPIPAALAGLSLGYLLMQGSSSSSGNSRQHRSYSSYGSPSRDMQQASQAEHQASEKASQYAHGAIDQASYYADQARVQARETSDWFQHQLHQNPLTVGAIAVAVGVAVGLAAPETQVENGWMGEARDSLVTEATATGRDVIHKVQHVAEEATNTATQEAKQQGLTG